MHKKYVFVDLDGTVIDHSIGGVPESTREAISIAKNNGHEIILTTGRPPCLFYGIDKEIGVESFIAANGRFAMHKGKVIHNNAINPSVVSKLSEYCFENKIDLAFEGLHDFKRQSTFSDLYIKFSKHWNIEIPELDPDFHKHNDVYQMALYYDQDDWQKFQQIFPDISFAISNKYALDVNSFGGLKEEGIQVFMDTYNISNDDVIAIGDGYNDISMLQFVKTSVAMGNASDFVKQHAKYVTDDVSDDGFFKAFKMLNLI